MVAESISQGRWRHQKKAHDIFLREERGVLNMATGTGKTRVSLKIMNTLFESGQIRRAIFAMDGTDLLKQWFKELVFARSKLSMPLDIYRDFGDYKELQDYLLSTRPSIFLVSRGASPNRDPLRTALKALDENGARQALLVHDEVHRLGSLGNRTRFAGLADPIRFRLGLSATPEREYDEDGTDFIYDHIGPEIFKFGLEDAIKRGILAPFNYFPLDYEPTDGDRRRLRAIHRRRYARAKSGRPMSDEEFWIELARVYKTSEAKIPILNSFLDRNQNLLKRCIIFVETQEHGSEVLEVVHRYRPDFRTYFAGEDRTTLTQFARGDLQCLITCHRISEGIDIRSVNTVILLSAARARLETIQRIGRCLRINPENPSKIANVVDFVRSSDTDSGHNSDVDRRHWLSQLASIRQEEFISEYR